MVWQAGKLDFAEFFVLFLPSLANWTVPALCMHAAAPRGVPSLADERVRPERGAWAIVALFAVTVARSRSVPTSSCTCPPFLGDDDRAGPAQAVRLVARPAARNAQRAADFAREGTPGDVDAFDSYEQVARAGG